MQGDYRLKISQEIPMYRIDKKLFRIYGDGNDSYCFWEDDLEYVVNLINFIYSTDGQKLKEIIISPDYETQKFGFQILSSFGFEKDEDYEELIYYMFLWS